MLGMNGGPTIRTGSWLATWVGGLGAATEGRGSSKPGRAAISPQISATTVSKNTPLSSSLGPIPDKRLFAALVAPGGRNSVIGSERWAMQVGGEATGARAPTGLGK
jgi:hypothetical protein